MRFSILPRSLPLAVVALLAGCGGDESADRRGGASGVTVRDSAGIRIIENFDSAWTEDTRWRLSDEPDLRIGSLEGDEPGTDWGGYVEVRTFGDRIAVIDFMSASVRLFDADGTHLRTLELHGEGPLEVGAVSDAAPIGVDSIAIWSGLRPRMLRLDLVSGSGSSHRADEAIVERLNHPRMLGWLDDGSWVLTDSPDIDGMEVGRHVLFSPLERFAPDGRHLGRIASLPVQEMWKLDDGISGAVGFAPGAWTTVAMDRVWHTYPVGQADIARIDPRTGRTERRIRLPMYPDPVEPEWTARARREMREQMEPLLEDAALPAGLRRRMERQMEAQPFADSTASIGQFSVADDGALWIVPADTELMERQYELPEGTDLMAELEAFLATYRQPMLVVDSAGRWLGTVELPARFDAQVYGSDYVLGTRGDDFGVQYVERYRILRPE